MERNKCWFGAGYTDGEIYLPFYDVFRIRMEEFAAENAQSVEPYVPFVASALARSLACTTCYPIELARTRMQAFKETGKKPPGVLKTLIGVVSNAKNATTQSKCQRRELITSTVLYLVGALITAIGPNFAILMLGCFIYGIGIGLVTTDLLPIKFKKGGCEI